MINNQNLAVLSEKVAALEAAIKSAGIELPSVTTDDNGKTLQVVAGKWDKGMVIPELPVVTASDDGKALQVVNGAWATGKSLTPIEHSITHNSEEAITGGTGNCSAIEIANIGIVYIDVMVTGTTPDWVKIGSIGDWEHLINVDYIMQTVGQGASFFEATFRVSSNGDIYIFTPSNNNNSRYRTNLICLLK